MKGRERGMEEGGERGGEGEGGEDCISVVCVRLL